MSLSGAHRAAFRREASQEGRVFTIRDTAGYCVTTAPDGTRALPFWSKESRAKKVVGQVPAYKNLAIEPVELDEWLDRWLPDLEQVGVLAGINWAGPRATGYDMAPERVAGWLAEAS